MLRWRLLLGALLIATLVGLCRLDAGASVPGIWLLPVVIVITVLATKELLDLLIAAGMRPLGWVVHLMNLWLVVTPWIPLHGGSWATELDTPEFCLIVPVLLIFIVEMCRYRKPGENTSNLAAGVFALVYVGMMLRFAVSLRLSWGLGALISWIVVVKMGDTGAYVVGRLIGRRKMAPRISPGKTIEGAVGALLFSCVGSWVAFQLIAPESSMPPPWWGWLAFGLVLGVAGMVGDLAESLLKRDVGVKDSSTWLPGFGGVLDMLDSLLLAAPVAWFCWASGLVGR